MKRAHSLQKPLTIVFMLVLVLIPVTQGSIVSHSQSTGSSLNRIQENVSPPVACVDSVYSLTPDWASDSPHYSTGGAFADFNNDNWLDFIVSDGNDMGQGHVRLYMNDGEGHLPTTASWESADVAYNGHLDVADINGDGWCDVAVSYLGTGSSLGPIARVYMNNQGVLSSSPSWSANIIGNAFGVDFGDMNNDGRPDLAIATGWSYNSYHYHTYVYLNSDGAYGSTPSWQSADQNIYMNCLWVDADDDGWLDLAGIADSAQTQIYRNLGGVLETTASWYTADSANQFGIMLTAGDVTGDGVRELFATDNIQLGGDGYFKQYTGLSTGFFETTHSWGYYGNFGSAVALSDVNGDTLLDLGTGAWWEQTNIFLNQGTNLPPTPSWSSTDETVVEKIVFGNIGPSFCEEVYVEQFNVEGNRQLFYLPHRQIQGINSVQCDGITLDESQYSFSRDEGWITIPTNPEQSLEVTYRYSSSQDMAVTNWDPDVGNYLYYNKMINYSLPQFYSHPSIGSNLECDGSLLWEDITPEATIQGVFTISNAGDPGSLLNWEVASAPDWGTWTITPSSGRDLPTGETITIQVEVIVPNEQNTPYQGTILVINSDKPGDYCEVPVTLTTPYDWEPPVRLLRYPIVLEHLRSIACIFQKPLW
ncbi:MAG: VCBS repeat-containing protein [Candidatus Thermoplasmatota archaeon]|nr:VCBS repeat-containing protein [Candidatus Thermoplasmatota archaeon]